MTNLPASIGSSPLARGLRSVTSVDYGARRIIPARAGFTMVVGSRGTGKTDHPRSRGVYMRLNSLSATRSGSSPLARGLLCLMLSRDAVGGIIPARAGFTFYSIPQSPVIQDHPRSRGVYGCFSVWTDLPMGSSPLARGLHDVANTRFGKFGIIPARAGFTFLDRCGYAPISDHPRSRGVYLIWAYTDFPEEGSSPLARGLPMTGPSCPFRWRIIPARAGFTRQSVGSSMPRPDHPRSRGVYPLYIHRYSGVHGSSPLARGLRRSGAPGVYSTGIIPARAGFTLRMVLILGLLSDHPRSRGVYSSMKIELI